MQSYGGSGQELAIQFAILGAVMIFALAIQAVVCWFGSQMAEGVPHEHRQVQPGQMWLLMIPLFNLVWNFFTWPKIAQGYQAHFTAVGRAGHGENVYKLSMAYCIVTACAVVPCVNYLAGPASLVLIIIMLVQLNGLKTDAANMPERPTAVEG